MADLEQLLATTRTAAVQEAAIQNRGTLTDANGDEVLAPPVAVIVDYIDLLKQQVDAVLGDAVRRSGDPEAVPTSLTGFFRWVVDVLYQGNQQLQLGQAQQAAAMQVLSQTMGSSFAALGPRIEKAQADATASLLNNQANALAIVANDRRDEDQAADIVAVKARLTADELRQQAGEAATKLLQSQQAAHETRLALVEQQAASTKAQAEATAAGLALTQAQQLKDEATIAANKSAADAAAAVGSSNTTAIGLLQARASNDEAALAAAQQAVTAAQARADSAQALATTNASNLTTLQTRLTTDEAAIATAQQTATTAQQAAATADSKAVTARAQADTATSAAATAKLQADTALSRADAAQASATAVGARFREMQVTAPAVTLAAGAVQTINVTLSPAYTDASYGIALSRQGGTLVGVDISWSAKTASGFSIQLKNTGVASLALQASVLDVVTTHA